MTLRRPPALANWLLDRLGDTRRNTALAGDLLEEFRSGRSAAWYWRQTLIAVAHGIAHTVAHLRIYLLALAAAYAFQFVVTFTLWSKHYPPEAHTAGWTQFGMWVLLQIGYIVFMNFFDLLVFGRSSLKPGRKYLAVEAGMPGSKIVTLAVRESFLLGLMNYCLCAVVFPRFSLQALAGFETVWFFLWVFAPALARPSAPPLTVDTYEPLFETPQSEPALTVNLSTGRSITLHRQTLAQSVFAAGDPKLIEVVFGERRNLELLRRAIWLGGCRTRSWTLAQLDDLIDEAEDAESVIDAGKERTRPVGPRLNVKLWFCGDSDQQPVAEV